jgi:hypothetical protein
MKCFNQASVLVEGAAAIFVLKSSSQIAEKWYYGTDNKNTKLPAARALQ